MVGSLTSPQFLACPNVSCKHEPEYDSSVNETYCIICLERLPNESYELKVNWWMRQPMLVRIIVYCLTGFLIGSYLPRIFGSFGDG